MKIPIDTHTHSVASGHAYSTVLELARGAKERQLQGFVLTDHGPRMPGGPHEFYFGNFRVFPPKMEGVNFYGGVETNIMDENGTIDLPARYLVKMDFVLAGLHEVCFEPAGREENTRAVIAALANPYVDAISHPGNARYPVNIEEIVRAALSYGKALEINSGSFRIRPGSEENCRAIARLSAEQGSLLCCGSDAHYWEDVGRLEPAEEIINGEGAAEELVINSSVERFREFVAKRKEAKKLAYQNRASAFPS